MLLAVVMVTSGMAVVGGGAMPAYACSCRAVAVAESLANSDAAFVGVLTGRDDPDGGGPIVSSGRRVVNHFTVERAVKGELGPSVAVGAAAGGASCGLEVREGARTGLLLRRSGTEWTSSLCSQVDSAALLALAPGGGPGPVGTVAPAVGAVAPAEDVAAPAGAGSGPDWGFIGLVGILLLAVLGAVVLGGAQRRER